MIKGVKNPTNPADFMIHYQGSILLLIMEEYPSG